MPATAFGLSAVGFRDGMTILKSFEEKHVGISKHDLQVLFLFVFGVAQHVNEHACAVKGGNLMTDIMTQQSRALTLAQELPNFPRT